MRKMIRQIMTLATLCWMMAGCADEVIDRNGGKGEGRLLLTGIENLLSATYRRRLRWRKRIFLKLQILRLK